MQGLAGGEAVAEVPETRGEVVGPEHLAVDARHGGEDRRTMSGGEGGPEIAGGGAGMDDCRGADGPGIGEAGAERVGPVEGAGMEDAVVGGEPVPAVPHHASGPGGALGVHDALGAAAGAGGVDHEGGIVGGGVGEVARGVAQEVGHLGLGDDGDAAARAAGRGRCRGR